jgi:uncharacterized repeat protein (TIGR01451 family)
LHSIQQSAVSGQSSKLPDDLHASPSPSVIKLIPLGANKNPEIIAEGLQEGKVNYLIGNDRKKWRTNIPTYRAVVYKEIYPGIDMKFYGYNRQLEYDIIVKPGASPFKILLAYEGIEGLKITEKGDLEITLQDGKIVQRRPYIYQEIGGKRVEVNGRFKIHNSNSRTHTSKLLAYRFEVESYDKNHSLIIDPTLAYSTYLGGSNEEARIFDSETDLFETNLDLDIAVDGSGNAYVIGSTSSFDFPTESPWQGTNAGDFDAFITKLNATGTGLIFSTYLGGSGYDGAHRLVVDGSGNAYIAGETNSTDFPVVNAYDSFFNGGTLDAFAVKLNDTGSTLLYSTYLGGNDFDFGHSVAADASGNMYVIGTTRSSDFPFSSGVIQTALNGVQDAFVTKFNPDQSGSASLVFSTFLGGSSWDAGGCISVDMDGNVYVNGFTGSSDFPITPSTAFDTECGTDGFCNSTSDSWVTKLNSTGSSLLYSTYLGGSGRDSLVWEVIDGSGNVYLAGFTNSTDFPITSGAYDDTYNGGLDQVIVKVDPSASGSASLVYSTYLGGSGDENGHKIALDSSGNVYVNGRTTSTDFPATQNAFQDTLNGVADAYMVKLRPDPSGPTPDPSDLLYATYIGGSSNDNGHGIVVDLSGSVYMSIRTSSTDFPTTPGSFDTDYNGGPHDAAVVKFSFGTTPPVLMPIADQMMSEGGEVSLAVVCRDLEDVTCENVSVSNLPAFCSFSTQFFPSITCTPGVGDAGTYTGIEVTATDADGLTDHETFELTVLAAPGPPGSANGVLQEQWHYDLRGESGDSLFFSSSPGIADLGVNLSGGEPDADLEIMVGSPEYLNCLPDLGPADGSPCANGIAAEGIWRAFNSNGTLEWYTNANTDSTKSSPVIIDLDSDGQLEIATGSTSGVNVLVMDRAGTFEWTFPINPLGGGALGFYFPSSPAVADLDSTVTGLEVVIANRFDGRVYVFDGDNSDGVDEGITADSDLLSIFCPPYGNCPADLGVEGQNWDLLWTFQTAGQILATPAIGDVDGNGQLDVVIGSGAFGSPNGEDGTVYALDGQSGVLKWSYAISGGRVFSSAGLADFDGDGDLEVVVGTADGRVYFINGDEDLSGVIEASEVTFYQTGGAVYSSPAIGDTDGNGTLEVIIGSNDGKVYSLNYDPSANTAGLNWEFMTNGRVLSSPALVDRTKGEVYGSEWPMYRGNAKRTGLYSQLATSLDVYIGSQDGNLYLLNGATGFEIDRFGVGGPIVTSPSVADVDGDQRLEVFFSDWARSFGAANDTFWALEDTMTGPPPISADLAVTKTDSPDPVTVDDILTYTITVTNNGPDDATGVQIYDTLPISVNLLSITPIQGNWSCDYNTGTPTTVTCNLLENLPNGSSASVNIDVVPTSEGTITNTVNVSGNESDPNSNNNSTTEDTTVNPPPPSGVALTTSVISSGGGTMQSSTYLVVLGTVGQGVTGSGQSSSYQVEAGFGAQAAGQ